MRGNYVNIKRYSVVCQYTLLYVDISKSHVNIFMRHVSISRSHFKTTCLFVWGFSLIWRRPHYVWRATNFDLCSALMSIERWGFHKPATPTVTRGILNDNLRGPVTLTPVAERFAVGLSLPVFTTGNWRSNLLRARQTL